MSMDLKARLRRYRDTRKLPASTTEEIKPRNTNETCSGASWPDWIEAGFKTLKREVSIELKIPEFLVPFPGALSEAFPAALPIVIPDLLRQNSFRKLPSPRALPKASLKVSPRASLKASPRDLLFFDLETTGLSGGAGTIAFLAAFGRYAKTGIVSAGGNAGILITQYLLLDYPGESDFIERVAGEFAVSPEGNLGTVGPLVITYNGKSFDSQILKNRCLMNGRTPPEYFHADLLHPARRLWKRVLPDCSQATVEASVLGLDRAGDVPGAMAPEIWFSFLRSGDNSELLSICDHNVRDITGLAALFLAMAGIAADPIEGLNRYRCDGEALALLWRKALKRNPQFFGDEEKKTGEALLRNAARNGSPLAALILAKDAEWRLKDYDLALEYTDSALASQEITEELREGLLRRRRRLEKKRREKRE